MVSGIMISDAWPRQTAKRRMLQKLGLNTTTVLQKYKVRNVKQKPYEGKDIEIGWLDGRERLYRQVQQQ